MITVIKEGNKDKQGNAICPKCGEKVLIKNQWGILQVVQVVESLIDLILDHRIITGKEGIDGHRNTYSGTSNIGYNIR